MQFDIIFHVVRHWDLNHGRVSWSNHWHKSMVGSPEFWESPQNISFFLLVCETEYLCSKYRK